MYYALIGPTSRYVPRIFEETIGNGKPYFVKGLVPKICHEKKKKCNYTLINLCRENQTH